MQKKLINNYRGEAIYSRAAVINSYSIHSICYSCYFTQTVPLACLAGVALIVACIWLYQLTQSHKNIHELISEPKENIAHTFLEETGLKIYSLINRAASKA